MNHEICTPLADKQKSIFGRFVNLNSFAQGTGLGLSICQTLVDYMKELIIQPHLE